MVIAPRRDERGLRAVPLSQLEAENADIEPQRAFQIGNLQMDMADTDVRIDRGR